MRLLATTLVFAILCLSVACGSDNSDSSSSDPMADLQGVWKSDCISDADGTSTMQTLTFSGNTRTENRDIYRDNCLTAAVRLTAVFTFQVAGAHDLIPGAYKVNHTFSAFTAEVLDDAAAAEFNAAVLYGYADWAKGIPKDVAGRSSSPEDTRLSAVGETVYTIFKIEKLESGTYYYVGDGTVDDGTNEEKRPKTLDTTIKLKKQ